MSKFLTFYAGKHTSGEDKKLTLNTDHIVYAYATAADSSKTQIKVSDGTTFVVDHQFDDLQKTLESL